MTRKRITPQESEQILKDTMEVAVDEKHSIFLVTMEDKGNRIAMKAHAHLMSDHLLAEALTQIADTSPGAFHLFLKNRVIEKLDSLIKDAENDLDDTPPVSETIN